VTLASDGPMWLPRMAVGAELAKSTSEARRLIQQGAVKVDGERVTDSSLELSADATYLLQIGKRRIARVTVKPSS